MGQLVSSCRLLQIIPLQAAAHQQLSAPATTQGETTTPVADVHILVADSCSSQISRLPLHICTDWLNNDTVLWKLQAGAAHLQQEAVPAMLQHLNKPLPGC